MNALPKAELRIAPQEFHVLADRFVIRTRLRMEDINHADLMVRVRHANLSAGDHITIQCMNKAQTELYHEADFVVTSRIEALRTTGDDVNVRQINEVTFKVERIGEWWASSLAPKEIEEHPKRGRKESVDA